MSRLVLLLLVGCAAGIAWAAGAYKVGDDVGDETLTTADGKETKLSAYEDSAVLLFFFQPSARHAEADAKIVDAARKARAKQKLVVIGVARDAKAADAKKFVDDHEFGFALALDAKAELYAKFATKGMPWVALVDGKRKLKLSAAGVDEESLDAALTDVLGAKDGAAAKKDEKKDDAGGGKK
jgi:peroxiredoxin